MAQSKKRKNKSSAKGGVNPKLMTDDGQLCLTREHLLEIEVYRLKATEQMLIAQTRHAQAEQLQLNSALRVKGLRQEALQAEKALEKFRDEKKLLLNRLSTEYGIDFRKVTYDDETGIITVEDDTENRADGGKDKEAPTE